ncbi:PX domain-containing protein [Mucilaginibacter pedocola]|uniref:Uncharacterized protein n=1 Tax=Mucilaginibacter pedocola TaxID=1792845 RepID=A0A1S9PFX9_9SPHI|nr:hypothetical protein [Mucilaginibacter pedocola]OOQ59829.1 hypothetical protein BC343_06700 [Mucilaginibacter pedocola]
MLEFVTANHRLPGNALPKFVPVKQLQMKKSVASKRRIDLEQLIKAGVQLTMLIQAIDHLLRHFQI